jgi:hypothetical protein
MTYKIMTDQDQYSGLEYPTMQEAEEKLKDCPSGWWIDQWYYFYQEKQLQYQSYFRYDIGDINNNF